MKLSQLLSPKPMGCDVASRGGTRYAPMPKVECNWSDGTVESTLSSGSRPIGF